jgi:hypothetical protein
MHNSFENENIFHQIAILMYFFPLSNLTGQAGISDRLLPKQALSALTIQRLEYFLIIFISIFHKIYFIITIFHNI